MSISSEAAPGGKSFYELFTHIHRVAQQTSMKTQENRKKSKDLLKIESNIIDVTPEVLSEKGSALTKWPFCRKNAATRCSQFCQNLSDHCP